MNTFLLPEESPRQTADRIARTVALIRASPYVPVEPTDKQWAVLADPRLELLYAGQVGSGKTVVMLAGALMNVHVSGYNALLIRRSFPALSQQGGLMQLADSWLMNTDAKRGDQGKKWTFPSGAVLRFDHLETDADRLKHDGASISYCAFDEVTQITELSYTFLFSRVRRPLGNAELKQVPLKMRAFGNPTGKHSGWVIDRFVRPLSPNPDRVYYPSFTTDNSYIDLEEYRKSLANLDPFTRRQMEEGDWEAKPEGLMFSSDSFRYIDAPITNAVRRCRVWDLAATENLRSDYSVGTLIALAPTGEYVVEHITRARLEPGALEKLITATAQADGRYVPVVLEKQPGAAGVMAMRDLRQRVLPDRTVYPQPATGSKVDRAMLPSALASQGKMVLVKAAWNYDLIDEATSFPDSVHDDQVDSVSLGCHWLSRFAGRGPNTSAPSDPMTTETPSPTSSVQKQRVMRSGGWGVSVPKGRSIGPGRRP